MHHFSSKATASYKHDLTSNVQSAMNVLFQNRRTQMKNQFRPILFLSLLSSLLIIGCSDMNRSNDNEGISQTSEITTADQELALLKSSGITTVDPASGIFTISWRNMFRPMNTSSELLGNAMGVAFGSEQAIYPGIRKSGIDIGTVYLNYGGSQVEIPKQTAPNGGYVYTFEQKPQGGKHGKGQHPPMPPTFQSFVSFIPGGNYEFEITGSAAFEGIKLNLTAPQTLIDITNYNNGDNVSSTSDLTIEWTGGLASDSVLVMLSILPDMQQGKGMKGGQQKDHQTKPDMYRLVESNTGSVIISAATIADLKSKFAGSKLAVHVGQVVSFDTEHTTGTLKILLRNDDAVILNLQ